MHCSSSHKALSLISSLSRTPKLVVPFLLRLMGRGRRIVLYGQTYSATVLTFFFAPLNFARPSQKLIIIL